MSLQETLEEVAVLEGHNGWVTSIACPQSPEQEDKIISSSRDKTVMVWQLQFNEGNEYGSVTGQPLKALKGHSHFVQDVVVSQDGMFALSGSWDGTLRLWELNSGITTRKFIGHTKDVLSVAFSADNRQIVSGSRDKSIKLWNTLGECKYSIDSKHNQQDQHTNWVSCVRFSPIQDQPTIVSCGWDKQVKVWSLVNCKQQHSLVGHTGYVNYVTVSPDGSLCASGGKDGIAMLWDLSEGKPLDRLDGGDVIHSLCFSPNRYWLCASMESIRSNKTIKVWDLEAKETVKDIQVPPSDTLNKHGNAHFCTCMQWSTNGEYLYAGYTDGKIRVFKVVPNNNYY